MVRKVKKRKSGIRLFVALLLRFIIAIIICKSIIIPGVQYIVEEVYNDTSSYTSLDITPVIPDDVTIANPPSEIEQGRTVSLSTDNLNSPNAILVRLEDHTILMQKNSEEQIYPASLTKMMTTIVTIEELANLNEEIKLTNSTFQGLYEANASMAGFQPGEQVKAIDLLYGVMLPSGAECSIGLAEQIAGSEQKFVEIMNQKASELGMDNTHFENVTGLHDENHYTTVKDLAVLLSYALQNDTFREIFTSTRHSTLPTNKHPDGITFYSTMFEDLGNQNIIHGEILGGKTGFTDEAGQCLASLAKVGKEEYILISTGAKGDHNTEQYNITDALVVYNSIGK